MPKCCTSVNRALRRQHYLFRHILIPTILKTPLKLLLNPITSPSIFACRMPPAKFSNVLFCNRCLPLASRTTSCNSGSQAQANKAPENMTNANPISTRPSASSHRRWPLRFCTSFFRPGVYQRAIWTRTEPSLPAAAEMPWHVAL